MSVGELEQAVAVAIAAQDDERAVIALRALAAHALDAGQPALALRHLRAAATHAAHVGEGSLGRALGDLAVVLGALGEHAMATTTFASALAHLDRADDREGGAEVAVKQARSLAAYPDELEAAWADAARRCHLAGLAIDELGARLAAARTALDRDHARALRWLDDIATRFATWLVQADAPEATWARGELGALWLEAARPADAMSLLARAAHEEAAAGRDDASRRRLHQLSLCLAMLGQSA